MFRRTLVLTAVLALATALPAVADGALTAIHGVPGLPDPVDVYADDGYVGTFDFGESLGPLMLPAGDYDVEIKLGGVTILAATVPVADGSNQTAIAYLDDLGAPILGLFDNDVSDLREGRARLTVRHTAEAPPVAIELSRGGNGRLIAELGPFSNGEQLGPVTLQGGGYSAALLAGGAEVFDSGTFTLRPGHSTIVYAIGEFPSTFELFVQRIPLD